MDTLNDIVGLEAAKSVVQDLNLRQKPVFNTRKAWSIVWTTICFLTTLQLYANVDTRVYAAVFAVLFVYNLVGSPLSYVLDSASQKRLDAWIQSQREDNQ